ncbi:MAG TPA: helix-turn-helix transcriptional regulator [Bacillota bacterium]|nr:helix-turn-helix transcriptional regulator [Bacillota bacterium]HQD75308.1 helix-turn-helix transcriptional regulator [Bacillota bacterium]HUM58100.1 helix-turn-helix transcriptional regulator [Bacillota bacterium]
MKENISLTPEEVANILKIAKNTVYELIKRGALPAYRIGRKIRVDLRDVEEFKRQGKKMEQAISMTNPAPTPPAATPAPPVQAPVTEEPFSAPQRVVICGQDVLLDILTRYLERHPSGISALRHNVGSFKGLMALYQGKAHMSAVHLWAGERNLYNIPYVRRLLPGIPTLIVHLAQRMQGFYVARGNPKGIQSWEDLTRPDVRFINREKGCGTRILLDEQIRRLGLDSRQINGYEKEEFSHFAVASAVARGEADVGLGNEKTAMQVREIDFVPLQKERYELVMKKEDMNKPYFQAVLEILQSPEFKKELQGLGDYDLTDTGKIVADV